METVIFFALGIAVFLGAKQIYNEYRAELRKNRFTQLTIEVAHV